MEVRTIERFPGYGFRDDGVVLGKNGQPLRPWPTGDYRKVALSVRGARHEIYVHQAICEAFHGPRPAGLVVLHLDDDPYNCRADNLRWGTRSENVRAIQRRVGWGSAEARDCRRQIIDLSGRGWKQMDIARAVGCNQSTVSHTLKRHREALASSLN